MPRTIKNTLRFELHSCLCFGKADVADKLRLELLQVVFQEDVPPELLSFVLSFQKRKYTKIMKRRLQASPRRDAKGGVTPLTRLRRELSHWESLNLLPRNAMQEKSPLLSSVSAGTKAPHKA